MRRFLLILMIVVVIGSVAATAQEFPRAVVFGGYSYARIQQEGPIAHNFRGWNGEVTVMANRMFGFTGDIAGHYSAFPLTATTTDKTDVSVTHFLFGPQFGYYNANAKAAPFVRLLFGGSHANIKSTPEETATEWTYGFGGGMDVKINQHLAARVVQVDYLRTHFADSHQNNLRLSFGVSFMIGGK